MSEINKCEYCGKEGVVKGTLEAVSFVPETSKPKLMTKGVYGLCALACLECGRLSGLQLDPAVLKRLVSRK
jgi:hypothetical protein